MLDIKTLHTVDTVYSADSVEWCPHPEYAHIFAVGTYQLEEAEKSSEPCQRKGRIYLYEFDKDSKALKQLHCEETAAILDMKWLSANMTVKPPMLVTATALGKIDVFMLEHNKLKHAQSIEINPMQENVLALALDLGVNANGDSQDNRVLVSDSKGDISLLTWSNEREFNVSRSWHAHSFEAWICAFDKWDTNRAYTGGDDCLLQVYDLRSSGRVLLNKSHSAGVTSLLSHPKREHVLLTGSYDENLRAFDTRAMKQPLSEINLQGGIWRIKANPLENDLILCACMYHNFSIVQLLQDLSPNLVGIFEDHKSICYGSDWCLEADANDGSYYMATCSFYDHKLCVAAVKNV